MQKKRLRLQVNEELLQRLMCHNEKTAKWRYLRESLTEEAAEASLQLLTLTQVTPIKNAATATTTQDEASTPPHEEEKSVSGEEVRDEVKTPFKKIGLSAKELTHMSELFRSDIETQCSPENLWVNCLIRFATTS